MNEDLQTANENDNQIALVEQLSNVPVTKETVASPEFSKKYQCLTSLIKLLEQTKQEVDAKIKELMKEAYFESGEGSLVSEEQTYTYVPATTRESFDSKRFKTENPELYRKYVYISSVKESLRVTENKKKENSEEETNVIIAD